MLDRCCGLVNVSSTPTDLFVRRSSKTARLRTWSANSVEVRPSSGREERWVATSCELVVVRRACGLVMVRISRELVMAGFLFVVLGGDCVDLVDVGSEGGSSDAEHSASVGGRALPDEPV